MATVLPQTLSPALPAGTPLQEYSLLSVLGMGGFGITYLATDNNLQLKVAIKEFFPSSAVVRDQTSGAVALKSVQAEKEYSWGKDRFMREAQTLARFRHKNIVQVFRYFEGNDTCYMVMAYEEGQSLEAALEAGPARWDQQAVLALVMPLLDGLESVHAAGFLHRDIKPANIVLRTGDGSPVLIDFGAARAPASGEALTIVLSHGYGPPEQYSREGHQGPWTDIYALGGVLYRIVSGSVPPISLHRIKDDPIIPATFSGEGRFGPKFLAAIDLALSVDERKRPQSIAEWRQLLIADTTAATQPVVLSGTASRGTATSSAPAPRMPPNPLPTAPGNAARPAPAPVRIPATAPAAPLAPARSSHRLEEDAEPGLVGRIGQAMIAHPFLSLLLLAAALFAALHYLRRPAAPPPAPQAVAAEPAVRTVPGNPAGTTPTPPPAGPDGRDIGPAPATAPAPAADSTPAPDSGSGRATPQAAGSDGERLRELRRAALDACTGKTLGASCRFVTPRNELIDATCMTSAEGMLICRPQRLGQRPAEQPGTQGERGDAWRQAPVPRIPR